MTRPAISFLTIVLACCLFLCATIAVYAEEQTPNKPEEPALPVLKPAIIFKAAERKQEVLSDEQLLKRKQGTLLFTQKVGGLLTRHCLKCHGGESVKANFNLSTREALLESGYVDETADDSYLMDLIRHEAKPVMPFKTEKLSDEAIGLIGQWIDLGAPYDKPLLEGAKAGSAAAVFENANSHWAFQALRQPVLPVVKQKPWVENPIDLFVLADIEKAGLTPAAPAGPYTLVSRAYFDLLGLPPDPDSIGEFVENPDWPKLIKGLLNSEHYGERYGRHWLDVARYADTSGYGKDYFFPHAARYRDYVIESMNNDKPFNEFVVEQIAGDVLYPDDKPTDTRRYATGFYTIGSIYPVKTDGIQRPKRFEYERLTDAADVTGEAFLGLSFGCARCHDHKYDPLSQHDYFAVQSFFASSMFKEMPLGNLKKVEPAPGKKPKEIAAKDYLLVHKESEEHATLFDRGDLSSPVGLVRPGLPHYFSGKQQATDEKDDYTQRRLHLANWIVSDKNTLTARVIANRVWQWHFGEALVSTPNDFGLQGAKPTNPKLLDYLACYLIQNNWSLKKLHVHIMSSSTYRMSSSHPESATSDVIDRFPTKRMQAETIWDKMLAVSGKLNRKIYGRSVYPPVDEDWVISKRNSYWPTEKAESDWMRRGIYVIIKRSTHFPFFDVFNGTNSPASCGQRERTVVAPQALTMMNGEIPRKLSEAFHDRLIQECGHDSEKTIARAWMLAFGRPVTDAEKQITLDFLSDTDMKTWCHALFNMNEFLYSQ